MLELVEATIVANQINNTVSGKRIKNVIAGQSPHKFAFFHGDPQDYSKLLVGKIVGKSAANGGQLEVAIENFRLVFGDGTVLSYYEKDAKRPLKHQLLIEFEDDSCISTSVQMYGFISCFKEGEFDNSYYWIAKEKPSPISDAFNHDYFRNMISSQGMEKLSAKAFLATEQRIPGIGNGALQDILFNAGIHPKRKIKTLSITDIDRMFSAIKSTLTEMISQGGRDTEKDLFGNNGGYKTILSKKTVDKPCKVCTSLIKKEAYLGGSIYYCEGCQH